MSLINHVSTETLTTGCRYPLSLIVHQQRYRPSDRNKYVDIIFSAHDAFLE